MLFAFCYSPTRGYNRLPFSPNITYEDIGFNFYEGKLNSVDGNQNEFGYSLEVQKFKQLKKEKFIMKKMLVALGILTTMFVGTQSFAACCSSFCPCQSPCASACPCSLPAPCACPCQKAIEPCCPVAKPCCPAVSPACPCPTAVPCCPAAPCPCEPSCNDCCD